MPPEVAPPVVHGVPPLEEPPPVALPPLKPPEVVAPVPPVGTPPLLEAPVSGDPPSDAPSPPVDGDDDVPVSSLQPADRPTAA